MRSPTLQAFAAYLTAHGYRQTTIAVVISNLRQITQDGDRYPATPQALAACIRNHPSELRQTAMRTAWRLFAEFQEQRGLPVPNLLRESPAAALRRERAEAHTALPAELQKLRLVLLAPETRVTPARLATWTWGMFTTTHQPDKLALTPPREHPKDVGMFLLDRTLCEAAYAAWTTFWGRAPNAADYLFALPPAANGAAPAAVDGTA